MRKDATDEIERLAASGQLEPVVGRTIYTVYCLFCSCVAVRLYTLCRKKGATFIFAVTLANVDRF